jgi:hypothetical protein
VGGATSTRHRDLVDLALIARQRPLDGAELRAAVVAKFAERGIPPPERFEVPDVARFARGYRGDAPAALRAELDFDQATSLVKRLADPVLAGTAVGRWRPERGRWMELAPPELRRPEPRPEVALHERWAPPGLRSTATSSACDLSAAAGQRTAEAPTWPHRPLAPIDALRRACGCTEPSVWWD